MVVLIGPCAASGFTSGVRSCVSKINLVPLALSPRMKLPTYLDRIITVLLAHTIVALNASIRDPGHVVYWEDVAKSLGWAILALGYDFCTSEHGLPSWVARILTQAWQPITSYRTVPACAAPVLDP